jgi:hypothetical protein
MSYESISLKTCCWWTDFGSLAEIWRKSISKRYHFCDWNTSS